MLFFWTFCPPKNPEKENWLNVTLEQKISHKQHKYICSNSQNYTLHGLKLYILYLRHKIIRILSKNHVLLIYVVNVLPLIFQNLIFD